MKKFKFIFIHILIALIFSPQISKSNEISSKENDIYLFESYNNLSLVNAKLLSKEWILKNFISRLLFAIPYKIEELQRKSTIRKDYLKLIEIYPSKNNIKKESIKKQIKTINNKINNYKKDILILNDHLKFFNSKESFNIYKVNYKYKVENEKETKNKIFNWTSFCIVNSNYENEINQIRNILTNKIYDANNIIAKKFRYNIYRQKNNFVSESFIDNKICNHFKKFHYYDFKNY